MFNFTSLKAGLVIAISLGMVACSNHGSMMAQSEMSDAVTKSEKMLEASKQMKADSMMQTQAGKLKSDAVMKSKKMVESGKKMKSDAMMKSEKMVESGKKMKSDAMMKSEKMMESGKKIQSDMMMKSGQ